jgi:hypothetical protein
MGVREAYCIPRHRGRHSVHNNTEEMGTKLKIKQPNHESGREDKEKKDGAAKRRNKKEELQVSGRTPNKINTYKRDNCSVRMNGAVKGWMGAQAVFSWIW